MTNISSILIFDLDDTLYPERSYVESGFRAVADWLHSEQGWDKQNTERRMLEILDRQGRGKVFDYLLANRLEASQKMVQQCVAIYRHHIPNIDLYSEANKIVTQMAGAIYLVTDGHKIVQSKKIQALNITPKFKKIYITHRYGIKHSKPSTYCFDLIRKIEKCEWSRMAYIGDNPRKDFVNLNKLGMQTIRVLTGMHKNDVAKPGYEAKIVINNLNELLKNLN